MTDVQLLREYAERGAESAFAELVNRYTNLVYSAARRQVDSADLAAEIAQRVFIALASTAPRLAPRLAQDASLAGWLCRSARNLTLNLRRNEFRRQARERQVMETLNSTCDTSPDWESIRPLLDEAMSHLSDADYDALVMRFFNNQELRAVGLALGVSDDTAQKRVSRALEKLRVHLSRRGLSTTSAALPAVLSAHAVQAAPAGLAVAISTAALLAGPAAEVSAGVIATKAIAMTALQKTLITAAIAAAVGTGIYQTQRLAVARRQAQQLQQQQDGLVEQVQQLQQERSEATNQLAQLSCSQAVPGEQERELLRLRGEVARLRAETQAARWTVTQRAPSGAGGQALQTPGAASQPESLAQLLDLARSALESFGTNQNGLTDEQKSELSRKSFASLNAAFEALTAKAVKGDATARQTISQAVLIPELRASAVRSLGVLAGNGDENALQLLLEPDRNGLRLSSVVSALKPAADSGNARAIEALAAVTADPKQSPLWYLAANGLSTAAETGNSVAIDALIGLTAATNKFIRDTAVAGLARSAARENPKAVEALRRIQGQ